MKTDKYYFFWRSKSPFSNWHPAEFELDGIKYTSTEQHMMHQKALLFGDVETAEEVLKTNVPGKQKALGRQVKNFNAEIWDAKCKDIVYEGNKAKFHQNENLLKFLLGTGDRTIVEASPVDAIWGIGLAEDDPRAQDESKWRGKNYLGQVLTSLRNDLLNENI